MGLGLSGAYGAMGAQDALENILAQRVADKQYSDLMAMKQAQMAEQTRQFDSRLGLDRDKFGFEQEKFGAEAPEREARIGHIRGQTTELARRPQAEEAERAHDTTMARTQHGYRLGEIGAQAANRPETDAPGWHLQTVTDPNTNQTSMVRVNVRTGEVQPVQLPADAQPGGQRAPRLTAGQQDELATMKTVEDMSEAASKLGEELSWSGVGGLWTGSISQAAAKHLGVGDPREERLRNFIGNMQGTIAKLRGGTSFTANEQRLLEQYTPTINDSDLTIKSKLQSLKEFIAMKRQNTLQFAGAKPTATGAAGAGANTNDPLGIR